MAVVFDYGGTLVTFERPAAAIAAAYGAIAKRLVGLGAPEIPAAVLVREVHDRVDAAVAAHQRSGALEEIDVVAEALAAYRSLGVSLNADELDELLRLEQEAWWDGVRVDHDAVPLLRTLRHAGVATGLCSNAPYRVASLHDQLRHFGLAPWFDAVIFSAEVGWRKPSPRIFRAALEALGSAAEQTVMVGDSPSDDIAGARAAAMRTVLVRRGGKGHAGRVAADCTVSRLGDVARLVLGRTPIIATGEGRSDDGS